VNAKGIFFCGPEQGGEEGGEKKEKIYTGWRTLRNCLAFLLPFFLTFFSLFPLFISVTVFFSISEVGGGQM